MSETPQRPPKTSKPGYGGWSSLPSGLSPATADPVTGETMATGALCEAPQCPHRSHGTWCDLCYRRRGVKVYCCSKDHSKPIRGPDGNTLGYRCTFNDHGEDETPAPVMQARFSETVFFFPPAFYTYISFSLRLRRRLRLYYLAPAAAIRPCSVALSSLQRSLLALLARICTFVLMFAWLWWWFCRRVMY